MNYLNKINNKVTKRAIMSKTTFTTINTLDINSTMNKLLDSFNLLELYTKLPNSNSIYVSGSTAMNIAKNKPISKTSDLDLYVQFKNWDNKSIGDFMGMLVNSGYYTKKDIKNRKIENLEKAPNHTLVANLYKKVKHSLITKIKIDEGNFTYFSLANHIVSILRLENPTLNKDVDIIILKPRVKSTIEKLLNETFDYDIVKNYIYYDSSIKTFILKAKLPDIKTCTIATMTFDHFNNRVLNNIHEFNNFVTRYIKYGVERKYEIRIGGVEITKQVFINILNASISFLKLNAMYNKTIKEQPKITFNYNITVDTIKNIYIVKTKSNTTYAYNSRNIINDQINGKLFKESNINKKVIKAYADAIINDSVYKNILSEFGLKLCIREI